VSEQFKPAFTARDYTTLQNQIARVPDGLYLARRYTSEDGNLVLFLQNEKTSQSFYVQCLPIAQQAGKKR